MKSVVLLLASLLTFLAKGAEVHWNVFGIHDYDDYIEGGDGRSIYASSPNRSPEAGFIVSQSGTGYTRILTFMGEYSNCGNNATFWALATADTLIDYEWMQSTTPLLDMGLSEYRSEGTVKLVNNQSKYIAMIGRDLGDPDGYYTGWVKIKNVQGEIEIVSSAFADAALYVGQGATGGFAGPEPAVPTPEPSSGLLMAIGVAMMLLRRLINHDDFAED